MCWFSIAAFKVLFIFFLKFSTILLQYIRAWSFQIVVLLETLESVDNKEIKAVMLKGIDLEYSLEGLMLNLQYFGYLMQRTNTLKKTHAGKDWVQEVKGATEDDVAGWHRRHNGHESEQTLGDGERQGGLVCCCPWGHSERDMTARLSNNKSEGILNLSCLNLKLLHLLI